MKLALLRKDARLVTGVVLLALAVIVAVLVVASIAPWIPGLSGVVGWRGDSVPTMNQRLGAVTQTLFLTCLFVPYLTAVMLSIGESAHGSGALATCVPAADRTKVLSKLVVAACVACGMWVLYLTCNAADGFESNGWSSAEMAGVVALSMLAGFAAAALARTFMRCLLLALVFPQVAALVSTPVTAIVLRIGAWLEGMEYSSYSETAYQSLWPMAWRWGVIVAGLGMVSVLAWATFPMIAGRRSSLRLYPLGVWALVAALGGAVLGSSAAVWDGGYGLAIVRQRRDSIEQWRETFAAMPTVELWRTVFNKNGGSLDGSRWKFLGTAARTDPRAAVRQIALYLEFGYGLEAQDMPELRTIIEREVARRMNAYQAEGIVIDMATQSQPIESILRAALLIPTRHSVLLAARVLAEHDSDADQMAAISFLALRPYDGARASWCRIVELAREKLREERDKKEGVDFKPTQRALFEMAIKRAGAARPDIADAFEAIGTDWDAESLACLRNGVPDPAERK